MGSSQIWLKTRYVEMIRNPPAQDNTMLANSETTVLGHNRAARELTEYDPLLHNGKQAAEP